MAFLNLNEVEKGIKCFENSLASIEEIYRNRTKEYLEKQDASVGINFLREDFLNSVGKTLLKFGLYDKAIENFEALIDVVN